MTWPYEFPGAVRMGEEEEATVRNVVNRGAVFRYYGPQPPRYVAELEAYARDYYEMPCALAVNSGTGALIAAMTALGIGPGQEVIVPTLCWVATVGAVVNANAIPVLCEVDDSFTMDPIDLERKITSRTGLIVPVHMAGAPCDMQAIMALADKHGIPVLEDCAQCNGGTFRGRKVGTFGTFGMFSFQINKNCTAGEGGLLITNDEQRYARANAAHDLGVPWENGEPNMDYQTPLWGSGRRMSEVIGAVASVQLRKLPAIVEAMRNSKQRIKEMLAGVEGLTFRRLVDPEGDTGAFLICVLEDADRARRLAAALDDAGIRASARIEDYGLHVMWNVRQLVDKVPLSPAGNPWSLPQNAQSDYCYERSACPQSADLFERSVLMPVPSTLTEEHERHAADTIRAALDT